MASKTTKGKEEKKPPREDKGASAGATASNSPVKVILNTEQKRKMPEDFSAWYSKNRTNLTNAKVTDLHSCKSIKGTFELVLSPDRYHKYLVIKKLANDMVLTPDEFMCLHEYNMQVLKLELSLFYREVHRQRINYDATPNMNTKIAELLKHKVMMCDMKFNKETIKALRKTGETQKSAEVVCKDLNQNVYNKYFRIISQLSGVSLYGAVDIDPTTQEPNGIVEHVVLSHLFGRHYCDLCKFNKCGYEPASDFHILFMSNKLGSTLRGNCAFTDNLSESFGVFGIFDHLHKKVYISTENVGNYGFNEVNQRTKQTKKQIFEEMGYEFVDISLHPDKIHRDKLSDRMLCSNLYNMKMGKYNIYGLNDVGGTNGIIQQIMPMESDAGIIARAHLYMNWLYIPYFNDARPSSKMKSCRGQENIDYDDFLPESKEFFSDKLIENDFINFDEDGEYKGKYIKAEKAEASAAKAEKTEASAAKAEKTEASAAKAEKTEASAAKAEKAGNIEKRHTQKKYWQRWFASPFWVRQFHVRRKMFNRWALDYKPTAEEITESLLKSLVQRSFNPFVVCVRVIQPEGASPPRISLSSFLLNPNHEEIKTIKELVDAIARTATDKISPKLDDYTLFDYNNLVFECDTKGNRDFVIGCLYQINLNQQLFEELIAELPLRMEKASVPLELMQEHVSSGSASIRELKEPSHGIIGALGNNMSAVTQMPSPLVPKVLNSNTALAVANQQQLVAAKAGIYIPPQFPPVAAKAKAAAQPRVQNWSAQRRGLEDRPSPTPAGMYKLPQLQSIAAKAAAVVPVAEAAAPANAKQPVAQANPVNPVNRYIPPHLRNKTQSETAETAEAAKAANAAKSAKAANAANAAEAAEAAKPSAKASAKASKPSAKASAKASKPAAKAADKAGKAKAKYEEIKEEKEATSEEIEEENEATFEETEEDAAAFFGLLKRKSANKQGAVEPKMEANAKISVAEFKKKYKENSLNEEMKEKSNIFAKLSGLLSRVNEDDLPDAIDYIKSLTNNVKNPIYKKKIAYIISNQKGGSSKKIYKLTTRKAQKLQSKITMKKK